MHSYANSDASILIDYENWEKFRNCAMSLADSLRNNLKDALHKKDETRVSTLRLLIAAIKNKEIEERKKEIGLSDEEILGVVQKEAKKRKDSIFEYEKAGRADLAKTEQAELAILEGYLPKELSDEEIQRVVKDGMRELEATGDKSFGALMKVVMPSLKGRASGDRISKIAREALESH